MYILLEHGEILREGLPDEHMENQKAIYLDTDKGSQPELCFKWDQLEKIDDKLKGLRMIEEPLFRWMSSDLVTRIRIDDQRNINPLKYDNIDKMFSG